LYFLLDKLGKFTLAFMHSSYIHPLFLQNSYINIKNSYNIHLKFIHYSYKINTLFTQNSIPTSFIQDLHTINTKFIPTSSGGHVNVTFIKQQLYLTSVIGKSNMLLLIRCSSTLAAPLQLLGIAIFNVTKSLLVTTKRN
jgi:hypothetical protein